MENPRTIYTVVSVKEDTGELQAVSFTDAANAVRFHIFAMTEKWGAEKADYIMALDLDPNLRLTKSFLDERVSE